MTWGLAAVGRGASCASASEGSIHTTWGPLDPTAILILFLLDKTITLTVLHGMCTSPGYSRGLLSFSGIISVNWFASSKKCFVL